MGGGIAVGFRLVEVAVNFCSSVGVTKLHTGVRIGMRCQFSGHWR